MYRRCGTAGRVMSTGADSPGRDGGRDGRTRSAVRHTGGEGWARRSGALGGTGRSEAVTIVPDGDLVAELVTFTGRVAETSAT